MSTWADSLSGALTVVRDTFPATVAYTPASTGTPEAITGIFDEAHEAVEMGADGVPISTTRPALWIKLTDLSVAPRQEDRVEVASRTFSVSDTQPDGAGGSTLYLIEN